MTNQEILTKAIQKAIDGGWTIGGGFKPHKPYEIDWGEYPEEPYIGIRQLYTYGFESDEELIYNKAFAKALWPELVKVPDVCPDDVPGCLVFHFKNVPVWKTRLQEMVAADDPIKYLGENI